MTETPPTQQVFGAGLRSKAIDLGLAALVGLFTGLGASWWGLNDLKNEVQRLSEKERNRSEIERKKADDDLQKAYKEGQMVERLDKLIKEQQEMRNEQRRR